MSGLALQQQTIWLTGASSGIGEALAKALQPLCKHLYVSARSEDKLADLANAHSNVTALAVDVTDPESVRNAAEFIQNHGGLDTVIANAGTCEYVDVDDFDTRLIERVMQTNFIGLAHCVEAALPLLKNSQAGYLVAVSSSSTWLAMPRAQAYGASKAAVNYFMESMAADLKHIGIDVSVVLPGFVKTPLTDLNDFPMPMMITAEDAAERIISGLEKRRFAIHFPQRFTLILKLLGLLPAPLRLKLSSRMSRLPQGSSS
ncbi:short-chain dehydrogenase [Bacterioplanes sanyensis]|uniref:Short-chain dehydrogenase n=1 Tax=Bacterioplanes sanyensis TaxID=1249553 RepID=A0A222FIR3_9GAMM|nr:SDR family NAD(P)-dependent oxidoreductase [Bacterioplanes sanyensis]ASP38670.1 short-chain dehydrogenase [Bacterioplanes sanyensis]